MREDLRQLSAEIRTLLNNTTGVGNITLGYFAGSNLTTRDNNIDIGNQGVAGEAGTIRVGTQGTQTTTFIAGISGVGVSGVAIKINAAGQLGIPPARHVLRRRSSRWTKRAKQSSR
jgi:hypothetical protein